MADGREFRLGLGELAMIDEVVDEAEWQGGVVRLVGDPRLIFGDGGQPLSFGLGDGSLEGFGRGDGVEDSDLVGGAQAAVVEIGEKEFIAGGFPIGFRGGEVESEFIFRGAQAVERGVFGRGGDAAGKLRAGLTGRAAAIDSAGRQRHGTEEDGAQAGFRAQVLHPRSELGA